MKKGKWILVMFLIGALLYGCGEKSEPTETKEETVATETKEKEETTEETVKQEESLFQAGTEMKKQFAENFSILYLEEDAKLLTDGQGRQMILVQKGKEKPKGYEAIPSIEIPIEKAIYTSTTQVAYLRAFQDAGIFDSIVGVRARKEDWNFDEMISRMENGQIVDIGDNTTTSNSYNHEIVQSLSPKLVFTIQGMNAEGEKLMEMLDQAKIPYLFDSSSKEKDYRGTMEWLKYYGAFYNLEDEAEAYFEKAMNNIEEMKQAIQGAEKPRVGWGIVAMGKVYVENGGSKSAKMVEAAGGEYIFSDIGADQEGVTTISVEELYQRLSDVDIFINRGMPKYGPDKQSIIEQAPSLGELACFQEDRVWQITDDFWSTYHNIDEKYVDLAAMFHPELYPNHEFHHFRIMPMIAE